MTQFEAVIELAEYFDGPHRRVALFEGRPHSFESRWLDVYGPEDSTDLFELTPAGAEFPAAVARAEFRCVGSGQTRDGGWPTLEAHWTPVQPAATSCRANTDG
ncbi:hypothetical protein FHW12_004142 [Dokdonella fugitiva]|uniref:Uncharacterized protein n=1 Tax=Dokdonella fugitiva TaxID=328517 RepID=A0A839F1C4_9GAMM|nr:hypothetical protein [Dokdonella fugitiva]MBA8889895.1 hypothetical protein [Dokdonella fugitiva]